jgi:hypothetical protein
MLVARHARLNSRIVLALLGLVYAATVSSAGSNAAGKRKPSAPATTVQPTDGSLPPATRDMVEAILNAVRSGKIDDLQDALDWNEMKPDLAAEPVPDPIAHWKKLSPDGKGLNILEVLGKLLDGKPAIVPLGRDVENNRLYVWPHFADTPMSKMTADELAALRALLPADDLAAMQAKDRYRGWRLVIGADGTWHAFRRMD